MKTTYKKAFAAVALLAAVTATTGIGVHADPVETEGFSLLGWNLAVTNRMFRVNNNFQDGSANNNLTPHVDYPGATGAVMAIWKGVVEWSSLPHGTGSGDPVGGNVIGSGGANFDPVWQGTTNNFSNYQKIHRALDQNGGSTFAFHQKFGSNWRIRYYENWNWQDGPGSPGFQPDIQGISCHEHGHALGLNHSNAGGSPTMQAGTATGLEQRSINFDDIAGVQAIYGAASGSKPVITGISGTKALGSVLTITGSNFSSTGNRALFTDFTGDGSPVEVTGLTSNGTEINVTIPANVQDGDVLVRNNGSGHASLSNPWPLNIDDGSGSPPFITGLTPNNGPNAGYTEVDITGVGFEGVHTVQFGGVDAIEFNFVNDGLIEAVTPPGALNDVVDVYVEDDDGDHTVMNAYTYGFNDPIDIDTVTPDTGAPAGGNLVSITGPNVIPVFNVKFGGSTGVPALSITIASSTELLVEVPPGTPGTTVDVWAKGFLEDTIVDGYTYDTTGGAFVDVGAGTGGSFGIPSLTGTGDLTPSGAGFQLHIAQVAPSASGVMFVGLAEAAVPFIIEGCQFYLDVPWILEVPLAVNGSGELTFPGVPLPVDPGLAGVDVTLQCLWGDATGPTGVATATNGLRMEIP